MQLQVGIPGSFTREDLIAAARANPRDEVGDDEIREALKAEILPHECLGYRVVDELSVCGGSARVDVGAIGRSELAGYEIKSELDTLHRLGQQRVYFGDVFDRMTLVATGAHHAKAAAIVPEWWGLIAVHRGLRRVELSRVREAKPNPAPDAGARLALLWVEELHQLAATIGLPLRGRKSEVVDRIARSGADAAWLRDEVMRRLLSRGNWRPDSRRT